MTAGDVAQVQAYVGCSILNLHSLAGYYTLAPMKDYMSSSALTGR